MPATRVRPFRKKKIRLEAKRSEIGAVSHVFRLFSSKIQFYVFASFRFQFFTSLQQGYFRIEAKRRENVFWLQAKQKPFTFASNISFSLKKKTFFA